MTYVQKACSPRDMNITSGNGYSPVPQCRGRAHTRGRAQLLLLAPAPSYMPFTSPSLHERTRETRSGADDTDKVQFHRSLPVCRLSGCLFPACQRVAVDTEGRRFNPAKICTEASSVKGSACVGGQCTYQYNFRCWWDALDMFIYCCSNDINVVLARIVAGRAGRFAVTPNETCVLFALSHSLDT